MKRTAGIRKATAIRIARSVTGKASGSGSNWTFTYPARGVNDIHGIRATSSGKTYWECMRDRTMSIADLSLHLMGYWGAYTYNFNCSVEERIDGWLSKNSIKN